MDTSNNERKEYELINLEVEYPGIKGEVKWAVVSELSLETLMRTYRELHVYSPVILLSPAEGETFKDFHKNEHKHEARWKRSYENDGYEDSETEKKYYGQLVNDIDGESTISNEYQDLKQAINKLPEIQQRRCKLYFYHGFTEKEIACLEGVDQAAVSRTLSKAINNLKKLF